MTSRKAEYRESVPAPVATDVPDDGRSLRKDAARNRELILKAAQEVFAEQGVNAPIEDIAKRAGVGIATLYRRFPTRPDLLACAFAAKMQAYADAIHQALTMDDAWDGFLWFVEQVCQMQAEDHGLADVLTMTFPMSPEFQESRDRAFLAFATLVKNAKKTGHLRKDFTTEDMPLILMANAGVLTATGDAAPEAWRRIVHIILQGLQAPVRSPLPPPVSPEQMYAAMQRA